MRTNIQFSENKRRKAGTFPLFISLFPSLSHYADSMLRRRKKQTKRNISTGSQSICRLAKHDIFNSILLLAKNSTFLQCFVLTCSAICLHFFFQLALHFQRLSISPRCEAQIVLAHNDLLKMHSIAHTHPHGARTSTRSNMLYAYMAAVKITSKNSLYV